MSPSAVTRRARAALLLRAMMLRTMLLVALMCAAQPVWAQLADSGRPALPEAVSPDVSIGSRGRFSVIFFESERRLAQTFLDAALANDTFPGLPRPAAAVLILVAPDDETFRAWVGAGAPEWGDAIAFPASQRIVMRGRDAAASGGDPRITLRHELAHLALHEALGPAVPRWFDEGYASYAAGEWGRDEVLATSFGLVWRGIPTFAGLDSGFYEGAERAQRSYALAHRAVAELAAMNPDRELGLLLGYWRAEGSFERALRRAHGMSSLDFEKHWKARIRRQFGALALAADLTVLTLVLTIFLGPMWWQRRQRMQERLARMREAERLQDERERASALATLLGEAPPDP